MPTFSIQLAHDVPFYGYVDVEANTWEEAVASLNHDVWLENCTEEDDYSVEKRVCYVEDEEGNWLAKDLMYDVASVYRHAVITRLEHMLKHPDTLEEMVQGFIEELRFAGQDPVFKGDK